MGVDDDEAMSVPAIPTGPAGSRSRSAPLRPPRTSGELYTVTPFCHNLDQPFDADSNDRMTLYRPVSRARRILLLGCFGPLVIFGLCVGTVAAPAPPPKFRAGTIGAEAVRECSGLVASRKHPGVYWTHNDGGNPPAVFAITGEGELIREYAVAAKNVDWEDLATDDAGHLFIADVGTNTGERKEVQVLRIEEPDPRAPLQGRPVPLRVTTTWRLAYPDDKPFDCEALFVLNGHGYVIPKRRDGSVAEIFRFALDPAPPATRAVTLERVTDLPGVRAPVTAADVSPDGRRLAVLTVFGPYVFDIAGDVTKVTTAKTTFSRYIDPVMEAACFAPEGLLVANESRAIFLFRDEHFKPVE